MHRIRGLDLQRREASALFVIEQVRDLARKIRARRRVSAVILYGSFARGDFHEGSDVDLIVVGDFRERPHRRAATILDLTDLPIEPICHRGGVRRPSPSKTRSSGGTGQGIWV